MSTLPASLKACTQRLDHWKLQGPALPGLLRQHPPAVVDADMLRRTTEFISRHMEMDDVPDPELPYMGITLLHGDETPARPTFTLISQTSFGVMQRAAKARLNAEQYDTLRTLYDLNLHSLSIHNHGEQP